MQSSMLPGTRFDVANRRSHEDAGFTHGFIRVCEHQL